MSTDYPTRDRRIKSVMSPEERDRLKELEVQMRFLREDTDKQTDMMELNFKEQRQDIDKILALISENRGSWKALVGIGSAGGVVTGIVFEIVKFFRGT